ncbi:MAG: dTDP-4-dehydrorhamnose 3,5-epimerase family protein [Chromatiales bacterium]|nr:dTDP-4-dehydrorhamnose 3,5-epimerase family protein [Chromatiales bacterium]
MIDGVLVKPLKLLPNERGRLMEIQRRDDPEYIGFGQCYLTETRSGVVKAWYRHHVQTDQIVTLTGLLKLVLYDGRGGSPTFGQFDEIIMGELAPKLAQFPAGIWHGFKAIGPTSAFVLHMNSEPYDMQHKDEDRLPFDSPDIPYEW